MCACVRVCVYACVWVCVCVCVWVCVCAGVWRWALLCVSPITGLAPGVLHCLPVAARATAARHGRELLCRGAHHEGLAAPADGDQGPGGEHYQHCRGFGVSPGEREACQLWV